MEEIKINTIFQAKRGGYFKVISQENNNTLVEELDPSKLKKVQTKNLMNSIARVI